MNVRQLARSFADLMAREESGRRSESGFTSAARRDARKKKSVLKKRKKIQNKAQTGRARPTPRVVVGSVELILRFMHATSALCAIKRRELYQAINQLMDTRLKVAQSGLFARPTAQAAGGSCASHSFRTGNSIKWHESTASTNQRASKSSRKVRSEFAEEGATEKTVKVAKSQRLMIDMRHKSWLRVNNPSALGFTNKAS